MKFKNSDFSKILMVLCLGLALGLLPGCSEEDPVQPLSSETEAEDDFFAEAQDKGITIEMQNGRTPPAGQVTFMAAGREVTAWPYTGTALDGTPSDPVNLIFRGQADILSIREALLGLDGDRTAFGFPAAYPFDQSWTDCLGGSAQVTWEEEAGWAGGIVQLSAGDFAPLRFHLRLFRVDDDLTLGAAHFEVLIPGTAEHQVLGWEIAEQLVMVDLIRSGLLDPNSQPTGTELITDAPSFRTIPAVVYNSLPPELTALTGGPPPPVAEDVPLANDGSATVLTIGNAVTPTYGTRTSTFTAVFDQYVPRPFCSDGPGDYLKVQGEVEFNGIYTVDEYGKFSVSVQHRGLLVAEPVNPQTGEIIGDPFNARVKGDLRGWVSGCSSRMFSSDRMLTREAGGPQITRTRIRVREGGPAVYWAFNRCLDD